jgi:uncharacterized membrane protein YtjA (UPF0391 family)
MPPGLRPGVAGGIARQAQRTRTPIAERASTVTLLEPAMLKWALIFAVIALVAGLLGFTGIAAGAASVAKFIFFVFVVLVVLALVLGSSLFRR